MTATIWQTDFLSETRSSSHPDWTVPLLVACQGPCHIPQGWCSEPGLVKSILLRGLRDSHWADQVLEGWSWGVGACLVFDALVYIREWEARIDLPRSHYQWAGCSRVLRTNQEGSPDSPAGFPCPEGFHLWGQQH